MDVPIWFVIVMGMGITFIGLTCLVGLTVLLGKFCGHQPETVPAQPIAPPPAADDIPNRQELIAAVSAAIAAEMAEELGTDVPGIRILSFKKIS